MKAHVSNNFSASPFLFISIFVSLLLAGSSVEGVYCQASAMLIPASQTAIGQLPAGQKSEGPPPSEQSKKPAFSLKVTQDQIIGVSLWAKTAKLTDVAAELSRQLKIPVQLSPAISTQLVTVDFRDLVLETSMQLLAPEVFIDYELNSTPGVLPRPLGIFLRAYNEPPPPLNAVLQSKSKGIVISGDPEAAPSKISQIEELRVVYERGNLTVKAKEQLLVEVLSRIATEMGIPLEASDASTEMVTVEIVQTHAEDAILQLAPNIRLFVRADLRRASRIPLRITLDPLEKVL